MNLYVVGYDPSKRTYQPQSSSTKGTSEEEDSSGSPTTGPTDRGGEEGVRRNGEGGWGCDKADLGAPPGSHQAPHGGTNCQAAGDHQWDGSRPRSHPSTSTCGGTSAVAATQAGPPGTRDAGTQTDPVFIMTQEEEDLLLE